MTRTARLATVTLALVLLVPGLALADDGVLSLRMDDGQRLLVFIDGEEVGKTPLDLTLSPGRYDFEVKVVEYSSRAARGSAEVRSGQTTSMVAFVPFGPTSFEIAPKVDFRVKTHEPWSVSAEPTKWSCPLPQSSALMQSSSAALSSTVFAQ